MIDNVVNHTNSSTSLKDMNRLASGRLHMLHPHIPRKQSQLHQRIETNPLDPPHVRVN